MPSQNISKDKNTLNKKQTNDTSPVTNIQALKNIKNIAPQPANATRSKNYFSCVNLNSTPLNGSKTFHNFIESSNLANSRNKFHSRANRD